MILPVVILAMSLAACRAPGPPSASLQALVDAEAATITGRAGVWVKHLKTGEEAAFHADDTFNAASQGRLSSPCSSTRSPAAAARPRIRWAGRC